MHEKTTPSLEVLRAIRDAVKTPYHLYDEAALIERVKRLQAAFSWNAGYREYYAVKACPNPRILEILKAHGCGVDCASLTELMLARAVGFPGDHMMFSSNETPAEEFELARALGATINLDDITHIDFLRAHGGIPERIFLRYNPGDGVTVSNFVMGHPGESKFGMTHDQILESVRRLSALGVRRFGLHSFLVSNALDPAYYPAMARLLFMLALEIYEKTGAIVDTVNLSGGLGIPYRPEETPVDVLRVGADIRVAYEALIAPSPLAPLSIATELGRYITGPVGYLVATAIHEKDTYRHYVGLDASAVDLMRPAIYGAYHHITVPEREGAPCDRLCDVVGALCENNDKFAIRRMLPKIHIGDLVVIHDTGAHGYSMGYNYNGKLRSPEVLLHADGSFTLIRRRETPADYFATLDYPGLPRAKES